MILTPESLGWMDWEVVFPSMRQALAPHARLVVIVRGHNASWDAGTLAGIVPRYSTNVDFTPYDVIGESGEAQAFQRGRETDDTARLCIPVDRRLHRVLALSVRLLAGAHGTAASGALRR